MLKKSWQTYPVVVRTWKPGIEEVDESLRRINDKTVETEVIRKTLGRIDEVYDQLKPFERRDLMGLVLKSAKVNEREIILEIYNLGEGQKDILESVNKGEKVRHAT